MIRPGAESCGGPSDLQRSSVLICLKRCTAVWEWWGGEVDWWRESCDCDWGKQPMYSWVHGMFFLLCLQRKHLYVSICTALMSSVCSNCVGAPIRICTGRVQTYRIAFRAQITKHVYKKPHSGQAQAHSDSPSCSSVLFHIECIFPYEKGVTCSWSGIWSLCRNTTCLVMWK